ncbi:MAG TPA: CoA transferase, partial [Caulobacteraceae bacterium]|nr:CoA transferase [Caulobacteraceae bacterium]
MTAFAGLRVLDVSQGLVGPMAAMLLGDFGAQVLKVEPPGGDRMKDRPGYLTWNRNKRRTVLDLDEPGDLARLKTLIAGADVVVFDQPPGVLEPLGLGEAALSAEHPRLVRLWVPPFGTNEHPWSALPAHHAMLTGLTGAAFRQGSYADQPVWHVAPIVHYGQAVMAASATGAALLERAHSGRGQGVTVSGLHGLATLAGPVSLMDGAGMKGHPLGGSVSYRLYQCGDGEWLFLGALFPHFFQRAIDALGLARMRQFPPGAFDIGGLVSHVLRQGPREAAMERLRAHAAPAAPVGRRSDWLKHEVMASNGMRAELDHPELGPVEMPGVAVRLSATPGEVRGLMREATTDELAAFASPQPAPPAGPAPDLPPLAGVRVLDLGTVIAGAYASAILANFGAEVIKVEPAEGDPFRPYGTGFMNYNRGKQGLGLDLKTEAGRALFLDLVRGADVVIDNFRHGVRERLGIDYAALKAVNPRIVSLSITAYGSGSALADQPGFDPLLQALSGLMQAQGGEGNEPVFHAIPVNDVATAAMASFGVMAALNARERSGEGQNVETSLAAQSALFQSGEITAWAGSPAPPDGSEDCVGFAALDRYYPCADGWLTLACTDRAQFAALAQVLGQPDWPARFADPRAEPRDGDLAAAIRLALAGRRRDATVAA